MSKPTKGIVPIAANGDPAAFKLSPETMSRYLQAVAGGNYGSTAAAYAGVTPLTVRRWVHRAEQVIFHWDTAHPERPLEEVLEDYLAEHADYALNDAGQKIRFDRNAPVIVGQPGIPVTPVEWRVIVLNRLLVIARAEATVNLVARISRAAQNPAHWQAAAWMLERTQPELFARRDAVAPLAEPSVVSSDELLARVTSLAEQRAKAAGKQR